MNIWKVRKKDKMLNAHLSLLLWITSQQHRKSKTEIKTMICTLEYRRISTKTRRIKLLMNINLKEIRKIAILHQRSMRQQIIKEMLKSNRLKGWIKSWTE